MRAVKRGQADVTALGQGPPLAKEEVVQLAAQYPAQLHFSTAFNTEYFFLEHPYPAVRRCPRPPGGQQRLRPRHVRSASGAPIRADVPNPATQPPRVRAHVSLRPERHHGLDPARQHVKRCGAAGVDVTVWMLSPIAAARAILVSVLNSIGFRADVKAMNAMAPTRPDLGLPASRSSRVLRLGRELSVGGRLHPPALELRRVRPDFTRKTTTSPRSATRRSTRR